MSIPIGALHDGRHYLAERYQNALATLGLPTDLFTQVPPGQGRVLGLGVSKRHAGFSELPGVPLELRAIVSDERQPAETSGVMPGLRLLDEEFTADAMRNSLPRPEAVGAGFNVVHLATHFRLGGNYDESALLLGDGTLLSLQDIATDKGLTFERVGLLTLSACDTGVTLRASNGSEVESLGMIAQQKGAQAVLATLWKVADDSTQLLMAEFYRLRKENPNSTKAAALQMAQQAMLAGRLKPNTNSGNCSNRAEVIANPTSAPPFKCAENTPFAHPYFWSPFVLIGNWR